MSQIIKSIEEDKETDERPQALTLEDLGRCVTEAKYLIRGSVFQRAQELKELFASGVAMPFPKFYPLHNGNPQLIGQPPITFLRQVIAGAFCPSLLDTEVLAEDVKQRVRYFLTNIPNGAIGAYSEAIGFKVCRKAVENYISKRDGYPANSEDIYLLDGTLDGMIFFLRILFSKPGHGVRIGA